MAAKKNIRILIALGLLSFIYNTLKCVLVPFYWDEIYTYLHYVKEGSVLFLNYDSMAANNHLLNTWLIKIFVNIFGVSEFILRLPNLLFFILYIYCAIRISLSFKSALFIFGSFIILALNPFMNDYFCLARGYGISMALLMANLYYTWLYIQHKKVFPYLLVALTYLALALLANLTLLNYFIIYLFFIVSIYLVNRIQNKQGTLKQIAKELSILFSPAAILFLVIPIILNLRKANAFIAGMNNGFWEATIVSLVSRFLYFNPFTGFLQPLILICVIIVLISFFIILIFGGRENFRNPQFQFNAFLWISIMACFISNYLQNNLMGVLYGYGRTALYYCPLFALLTIFSFQNLQPFFPKACKYVFSFILLIFIFNFSLNASLTHAIQWRDEGETKYMVKELIKNKKTLNPTTKQLTVGLAIPFKDDMIFYKEIYQLPWLNWTEPEHSYYPLNDYFYIPVKDTLLLPKVKYKILKEFPIANSLVIENLQKWEGQEIINEKIDFEDTDNKDKYRSLAKLHSFSGKYCCLTNSQNDYSDGFIYTVQDSTVISNPGLASFSGMFYTGNIDKNSRIVISFDRNGKTYEWHAWETNDYLKTPSNWEEIKIWSYLPIGVQIGDEIRCYIWNTSKTDVYIDDMRFKVSVFKKDLQ